ncbi:PAS domain-containing protein [Phormidium tenue FACHB-886]|nr:PAS domain-containing protein [Phormidium tenue FACHB-886]
MNNSDWSSLEPPLAGLPATSLHPGTSIPIALEAMVFQLADGSIQGCNAAAEQILGLTKEQMQGLTSASCPWQVVHEDGSPLPHEQHPASIAFRTGQPCLGGIVGVYHPNGKLIWLQINAHPLFQANGTVPYAVVSTFREMPELEQTLNPFAQVPQNPQFIEQVIQHLPGVVYLFDVVAQQPVYISPQAVELLGYSVDVALEMGANFVTTMMHPDDRARLPLHFEQVDRVESGNAVEFQYRMLHLNGEWRWFASQDRVFRRTPNGRLHQVLGIAQEITAQKGIEAERSRMEQELREANYRITSVLESMTDAFLAVDCNWRFSYVNQGAEQILGKSRNVLLGKILWDEFPDAVNTLIYSEYHRAIAQQVTVSFELYYPPFEGWYEINAYPSQHGLAVYFRNITQRKEAENALCKSQAQLQQQLAEIEAIYQSAPIGLNVLDTDLRFVRINQQLAEMNGLPIEAHLGRTVREVLPDLADAAEQLLRPILETGEPLLNVEINGETPAQPGVQRTWLEHFLPLKDGNRVIGISTVCEEITKRKQAEEEREQLLAREQAARETAEQANRIKDEFLAVLSHELRSPLNPILGWAKLLQSGNFSQEETQQALATIERNAKLQAQLIEDLLDISRIIRGKLSLNFVPMSLVTPIAAAIETVHHAAEAKAIAIETRLDPTVKDISGDAGRLQQVVWNLLSNAIKFTPQGGRVTVRLEQSDRHAQIQISDTGRGIDPEFLPYLFEMFRQQDSSTTRQFGGLGLGLAISRQLVEAHGGTIAASSAGEGQGATMTVRLPLIALSRWVAPDPPSVDQAADLQGMRVLVVDDEPDSLEFLQVLLEQEGAIVTAVESAQTALTVLAQTSADVLVSDIQMPQMDGYSLIHQLRSLRQPEQLPAIALTAYASEVYREQSLAAGYQQHLAKPIDPPILVKAIAQLVRSRSR